MQIYIISNEDTKWNIGFLLKAISYIIAKTGNELIQFVIANGKMIVLTNCRSIVQAFISFFIQAGGPISNDAQLKER